LLGDVLVVLVGVGLGSSLGVGLGVSLGVGSGSATLCILQTPFGTSSTVLNFV